MWSLVECIVVGMPGQQKKRAIVSIHILLWSRHRAFCFQFASSALFLSRVFLPVFCFLAVFSFVAESMFSCFPSLPPAHSASLTPFALILVPNLFFLFLPVPTSFIVFFPTASALLFFPPSLSLIKTFPLLPLEITFPDYCDSQCKNVSGEWSIIQLNLFSLYVHLLVFFLSYASTVFLFPICSSKKTSLHTGIL